MHTRALYPWTAGITGYPLSALRYLAEHATVPIHTCITYSRYNLHDRSLVESGTLAFLQALLELRLAENTVYLSEVRTK